MPIIRRFHIRHMEEAIASNPEVHERCLYTGFDINDTALVNIPDVAFLAGAFDVQLFKDSILHDRDAAFLGLEYVDKHLFLHAIPL
jgi:hypothetical protein